jgi:putative flippase GtrA
MRDLISKLSRYAVTGGIAAVVDLGGFDLLMKADFNIAPASVVSFCAAALVNYRLTSHYVFGRDATIQGLALFLLAALTGLTVNVGATLAGVSLVGLPPLVAKLVGIGTAFLVNFGLNIRIVFRAKT